ncbi:bd-type cytochrome oxidase subunit I [Streptomyces sp. TLI_235]|nr:bd-type cytochrome oxidase subunit I [Streptomyces sp. TLI_235]
MTTAPFLPAGTPAQLLPARELVAFTPAAHITLVPPGVALPFVTPVMHHRGLRRNDPVAVLPARRRSAVTAVRFAVGIVTGTVPSFEFGLLWPGMTGRRGDVPTAAASLRTMSGVVVGVHLLLFAAFRTVLPKMRTRRRAAGTGPPPGDGREADTPYGPRPATAAGGGGAP